MKLKKPIADLQVHGWTSWETGMCEFPVKILEPGKRTLLEVLKFTQTAFPKKDAMMAMTNFDDTRYEGLINTRNAFSASDVYDDYKDRYVGVSRKGNKLIVIRGQEIATNLGHVVVLLGNRNISSRNFEVVAKQAKDMGAFVMADHPLEARGAVGRLFNKAINKGGNLSLGEDNLRRYRADINGLEIEGYISKEHFKQIMDLAKELEIEVYAGSDSHYVAYGNRKGMFSSYTTFNEIDATNPATLLADLRKPVKGYNERQRPCEGLIHPALVIYNTLRFKTHLMNRQDVLIN